MLTLLRVFLFGLHPKVKQVDVFRYVDADKLGSIFHTTGDMAIGYCRAYEGALRVNYGDGSCLYPQEGDIVITLHDGRRRIV